MMSSSAAFMKRAPVAEESDDRGLCGPPLRAACVSTSVGDGSLLTLRVAFWSTWSDANRAQTMTPVPADRRACPICDGVEVRYRRDWLSRCASCGLLRAQPPIGEQAVGGASIIETKREAGLSTVRDRNNAKLLAAIAEQRNGRPAKILDVGCGHGFFLSLASLNGHEIVGIEPDAHVAQTAKLRNPNIIVGSFPDSLDPQARFEAIVFNDVFEHLASPEESLAAVSRHFAGRRAPASQLSKPTWRFLHPCDLAGSGWTSNSI